MSESSFADSEPQTPPRYPKGQDYHGDVTPSFSSPSVSLSLSFPSPNRSLPFSPLHHEASPQNLESLHPLEADGEGDDRSNLVRANDSKDVLIQRLNLLTARLAAKETLTTESVDSMHAKVDELEHALLHGMESTSTWNDRYHSPESSNSDGPRQSPKSSRPSRHGTHSSKAILPEDEQSVPDPQVDRQESLLESLEHREMANMRQATHLLAEARKLQHALESIVQNLKARQEEQEHIHDLLITRAERAAQRIIYLEGRVMELENERNEGEMEILNLQIQLKAIEVQCLSYIPKDADSDLLRSIDAWKSEWSALKRNKVRKEGKDDATHSSPTPRSSRRQILRSQTAE